MGKNQLHQLLAVEPERRNRATEITQEAFILFTKKEEHLDGLVKTYNPFDEKEVKLLPEVKEVVTTVSDKIAYISPFVIQAIDAQISKEETNASGTARAELKVGEKTFGELSATSLLALEQHLQRLLGLYRAIPTLDPAKKWMRDSSQKNRYITDREIKFRTNKQEDFVVVVPPTKEHPAQIAKVVKDVTVGTADVVYMSGRITPAEKSDLLSRIDSLIVAVKQARSKANETEVQQKNIGKSILDFINNGIL